MRFEELRIVQLEKLQNSLPAYLTYHNLKHTQHVLDAVVEIGEHERLSDEEMILVKTAALLHDMGFIQNHENHESLSCKQAQKVLPDFGYSETQIQQVCSLIMATRMPQTPHNVLSEILCDADLFYIGSTNYEEDANALRSEMLKLGLIQEDTDWLSYQIKFLSEHKFFTHYASNKQGPGKQMNLEKLFAKRAELTAKSSHKNEKQIIQDGLLLVIGIILAAIGLKGFLVPNHFFDGGITGISLLIHEIWHFNLGVVLFLMNLPLMITSYYSVGKKFAVGMAAAVIMLGIAFQFLPVIPLTSDKLLISIFGGVFLGTGVGLVMRSGTALDGIEVVALYTVRKTSFTIIEIIMGINIMIFSIAAFKFGIETALYSILTYFTATRCIDYVVEGIQAFTGVTIISAKSEVIKYQLVNKMGKGITVYHGERGFLPGKFEISNDCDIIFTIITRLELRRLKNLVAEIDPQAFIFANTIKEASGGIIKRKSAH